MNQEKTKEVILSRITINKEYWRLRIEELFEKEPEVTREKWEQFFKEWAEKKRNNQRRSWIHDLRDVSIGRTVRMEDAADVANEIQLAFDELELADFQAEMALFADQFRINAVEAFNKNDRYTCAIFYTLYAIAMNQVLGDIYIKYFLLEKVFAPSSEVSPELSLDELQKKDVVDLIFDRSSSISGFGWHIASLDFSLVENENLPFETNSHGITFFDFIGICKRPDIWPDIRNTKNQR